MGLVVFSSLAEAIRAGYHVLDRTAVSHLVGTRTEAGWAPALARCR
jgi:hypothetical protein